MKTPSLLLLIVLFCGFRIPSVEVAMQGHLRSKTGKNISGVTVFVKGCINNGQGHTTTDEKGNFELNFDDSDNNPRALKFYYVDEHRDTILLKRISKLYSDTPEMTFWIK